VIEEPLVAQHEKDRNGKYEMIKPFVLIIKGGKRYQLINHLINVVE
jgi:hypothetical protein